MTDPGSSNPREPLETEEEYFDNHPTGVEAEADVPPTPTEAEPWDPEKIRIHTKHYSLRQIVDMVKDGDIDLAPDFQRKYVWKDWQRWGLIESLLLGIPLPSFYFNEDREGKIQVVDGVQRLTTIYEFVEKRSFCLGTLVYLKDLQGAGFDNLDGVFRRRLLGSQFVAHAIDPQTPYRVKFDIFRRINTGGTPLSAQEIRHCMSGDVARSFLKRLAQDPAFVKATGGSLTNHPRMADREVALRFVAFRVFDVETYAASGGMDGFLGRATEHIDRTMAQDELDELHRVFACGMRNAYEAFGDHAFRKWPHGTTRRNPVNRALVETWGTVLCDYDEARIRARHDVLVQKARDLMTGDAAFIAAIIGSTADANNVRERFAKVRGVAREVLG